MEAMTGEYPSCRLTEPIVAAAAAAVSAGGE
nr:MAG TPA_asm: hypothetical protein [Caudoviricetes sp.]